MPRLALLAVALLLPCSGLAAPGDLDPAYGTNGVARTALPESDDTFLASAVRADGSILSWGFTLTGGVRRDVAFTRHLADGTLDAGFGVQGRAKHTMPSGHFAFGAWPYLLAQSGDRYVIAVSCSTSVNGTPETCLARFHGDGTLDTTFAMAGWQRISLIGSYLMAVRPDDRLVLAYRDGSFVRAMQLTPDGAFDTYFGAGGVGSVAVTASSMTAMALLADGKLLIGGGRASNDGYLVRMTASGGADPSFGLSGTGVAVVPFARTVTPLPGGNFLVSNCGGQLARATALGDLDVTYGTAGIATIGLTACPGFATRLADGSILLTESRSSPPGGDGILAVMKVSEGGVPDAGFGTGGLAQVVVGGSKVFDQRIALDVLGDGSLLAGVPSRRDFGLVRLTAQGTPMPSFGTNGLVATDLQSGSALTLVGSGRDGQGRIVGVGSGYERIRILADGTRDSTFASTALVPAPSASVAVMAVQADGRTLVSQSFAAMNEVRRFNADGTQDGAFGTNGVFTTLTHTSVNALASQADGKVAFAGAVSPAFGGGSSALLGRLLENGNADGSFGPNGSVGFPIAVDSTALTAIAVQPDGKWLSAGYGFDANGSHLAAARTIDGTLDPAFGFNGRFLSPAFADLGGTPPRVRDVLLRPDGRSVLVASVDLPQYDYATGNYCRRGFKVAYVGKIVMTALDAAGVMEPAFATDGRLSGFIGLDAMVHSAALDDAGRILVAGVRRTNASSCDYAYFVARYTIDGHLDLGFGSQGVRDLGPADGTSMARVFPESNGKLRVLGVTTTPVEAPIATWRLLGGDSVSPGGPPGDADNDGIPDEVEAGVGRNPLVKDNDIFGDARLFAMQQYRDFIRREGDAPGIAFWTNQITTNTQDRAETIRSFFDSYEFQVLGSPVVRLYFAYFLRIPDYAGVDFWMGQSRAGTPLATISQNFAASAEFDARYGALNNSQFVDLVYQNVLGRAPDAPGKAFWQGQLDANAMSRGQVMLGFSESDEYRISSIGKVFVTMMYVGMLRRAPEQAGFDFWVDYVNRGNPRLSLIRGFLASPEYRARFLP